MYNIYISAIEDFSNYELFIFHHLNLALRQRRGCPQLPNSSLIQFMDNFGRYIQLIVLNHQVSYLLSLA